VGRATGDMPTCTTVRVLGFDPGLGRLGFGLVEGSPLPGQRTLWRAVRWGVIETHGARGSMGTAAADAVRLHEMRDNVEELLALCEPHVVVIERLFFAKNITTAMAVSQARGVVLACIAPTGATILELTPMQVKQQLTGSGKATKQEVQQFVQHLLNLDTIPRPDDAADALAIAYCGAMGHAMAGR
jgi:crossover junction endodeoxyribonuclease RuvC